MTSTQALANSTLPYVLSLAQKGWQQAMRDDKGLAAGLNTAAGKLCCPAVAQARGVACTPVDELL